MIHLLDKIQGWVQSGPMGNDLMRAGGGRRIVIGDTETAPGGNNFLLPDSMWQQFKPHFRKQPTGSNILSQSEFEDQYFTGERDPVAGDRTRYYFDFDFDSDITEGKTRYGATSDKTWAQKLEGFHTGTQTHEGYMFYDKEDAYNAYKDTMQKHYDTGTGQFSGAGAYADVNPGDILNRRSLLDAFTSAKGGETRPEEVVPRIKASDLRPLHAGTYTPQVEREKKPIIDRLLANITSTQGLGSGFAGYGGREAAEGSLIAGYQDDVQEVYDRVVGEGQMSGIENLVSLVDLYDVATDDLEG